ncbi:MAG: hypothetical protein ACO393_04820 [Methylophilaceae bacterium]
MGYGYQERQLDKSVIDWSGLTKTISDNLVKEAQRRETLKFELEKTQQEELQKLNEYEQGLDPSANKWAMEMAQQARDFKMQNHKIMKAGLRSVGDSKLVSQNVMDGWTDLNGALKSYNETYKKLNEKGGKGNQFILQEMANFVDLKNKKIYYDPNSGSPYFANVDPKTGKMDENSLRPVRSFNNVQAQEFEIVDVESETTKLAQNTAAWQLAISSTRDIENARLNPTYQQWRDNSVKSILSSDQRTASVLMDYLNLDPTSDPNAPSGTVTYERIKEYDKNGKPVMETVTKNIGQVKMEYVNGVLTPKLTDEQRELAKDAVVSSLENKLAFKTTQQYVAPRTTSAADTTNANVASLVENFVTKGDFSALQSALSQKGFTGTVAPDANGIIKLRDGDGNLLSVNTNGKTAKEVGKEIAGFLKVGSDFEQRTISGNLNPAVLDPKNTSNYGTFSTKATTISDSNVQLIGAAKANPNDVKSAVQTAANEVGIAPSRITISNGDILLDGNKIGKVGVSTGPEIAQQLEQSAQATTTQKKSTITQGTVR